MEKLQELELRQEVWQKYGLTLEEFRESHHYKKQKLVIQLSCDCGNDFPVAEYADIRKCFSCDYVWAKKDGVWFNTGIHQPRDAMTIGDIPIRRRH